MVIKIYGLIWLLGLLAVAITYFMGDFSPLLAVLFGFLSFGTVFMGMLVVLPLTVNPHSDSKH